MSDRSTFSSEIEMKENLQGTYTYYSRLGAERQIKISGDDISFLRKNYKGEISQLDFIIEKWKYRTGEIDTRYDHIVVKKNRSLIYDGFEYEKGGYMSEDDESDEYYSKNFYYSNNDYSSYESAELVLIISDLELTSDSLFMTCTGSLKNSGSKTYKFVQVKGAFKDEDENVIDTASSFAVGSEGLAPGESTTFRLSVYKTDEIERCSVSVIDYRN